MKRRIGPILIIIGVIMMIVGGCIISTNSNINPCRSVNQRVDILEAQMNLVVSEIGKLNREKK